MAGVHRYTYPPDDEIVNAYRELRTIGKVADRYSVTRSTFESYIRTRDGLQDRIEEVRATPLVAAERAINDPFKLKADQDAATIKALKRENVEYAKALAKQEMFFDRIVEATQISVKPVKYPVHKQNAKLPARSVVVPLYDMQFGSLVQASETPGGKGTFNTRVFDERLARYVDRMTANIRKQALGYRMDELIFVFGGDQVEGDEIFPGMTWQLELDPPRQVWELAMKLADAMQRIIRFAREEIGFKRIALYGTVGNHGKVGGKRSGSRPLTYSWDWLCLKILFDRLRGEPVDEMVIEPAGLFFYAAGVEFQAIHGEHIRGWGGIPFYGIARFDARSVRLHNILYRYLIMGHIHQRAEITIGTGAEALVSGDWVGATSLSGVITAASRPQQSLIYVSAKMGVAETARIYLTDAAVANAPTHIYGLQAA